MKKKLSALIAAALCVTVGGVYATWQYAEKNASTAEAELLLGITSIESVTEKGSIAISKDSVTASIDHDKGSDSEYAAEYHAKLHWGETQVKVVFTPNINFQGDSIVLSCTLSETYGTYDHDNNAETAEIDLFRVGADWDTGAASYTFTLNNGTAVGAAGCTFDLSQYLHLNPDLTVPTSTLHTKLTNFLKESGKSLDIQVSEKA